MRTKRRVLYSFLILGILILYPIYTFVGCGNENGNNKNIKIEDKDKSTQYVNKQDEENKNTSKENSNNELDKNIKNEDSKQKVLNNNKKNVINDDSKKVVTPKESNKGIKSESQLANKKEQIKTVSSKFTAKDAVIACEKKYGKDLDTIYSCSENMKNVNGEKGYLVQVKSKELMKQGGNGVAFTVLVTPSGQIIEL